MPNRLSPDYGGTTFASGSGARNFYTVSLTAAGNCGGASACLPAMFRAERGARPIFNRRVALRGGRTGYFKGRSCGISCSPPAIRWASRGNLYTIEAKIPDATDAGQRRRLVAANSAIGAGPR